MSASARARARALLGALEKLRDERPPDPLSPVELELLEGSADGGWGEGPPPEMVLRARYGSGHGEESAHLLEREAALWIREGSLTRVALRDPGRRVEDRTVGDGEAEAAWSRLRAFFAELLPPGLPDGEGEPPAEGSHP